jgi:hypothetical protein
MTDDDTQQSASAEASADGTDDEEIDLDEAGAEEDEALKDLDERTREAVESGDIDISDAEDFDALSDELKDMVENKTISMSDAKLLNL